MAGKDKALDNYVEVKDRIALLYEQYPDANIQTRITYKEDAEIIFETRIFRTRQDLLDGVYTNGFAREVEGSSYINKGSHVENAETSSIGRALANMGFKTKADEPRPSREEIQKAQQIGEEHEAALEQISAFVEADDDIEVVVGGKTVSLIAFIKKNAAKIKAEPSAAARVLKLMAQEPPTVEEDEDGE